MGKLSNIYTQSFPPPPAFTERRLGTLAGKVFIVTGGASGVGLELVKLLYQQHGTVYVAGRSREKGVQAIEDVRAAFPSTTGRLEFLLLDLADLTGIRRSTEDFMRRETRLHVLWNNAGVALPPDGSKSTQGYELQLATNCLGPLLFTQCLTPMLVQTADASPPASVRVVWTGSLSIDMETAKGGMKLDDLAYANGGDSRYQYAQSKCGNLFIGSEYAAQMAGHGILSVTVNPGNLMSNLQRHLPATQKLLMRKMFLHQPIFGAYTELFAGLSPDVTMAHNGQYLIPWGRFFDFSCVRPDIAASLKSEAEGGTGVANRFYRWCQEQTRSY